MYLLSSSSLTNTFYGNWIVVKDTIHCSTVAKPYSLHINLCQMVSIGTSYCSVMKGKTREIMVFHLFVCPSTMRWMARAIYCIASASKVRVSLSSQASGTQQRTLITAGQKKYSARNQQRTSTKRDLAMMSNMPEPDSKFPDAPRLAERFTPQTPFFHPHLDPNLKKEDLHLVPAPLFQGRNFTSRLPRPAVANLHVMLKLTNDPDELRNEFHGKISQIDDFLGLWGELKGANSTVAGQGQHRARTTDLIQEGEGTTLHLARNIDTPGQGSFVYLTDAVKDSENDAEDSGIPSNLRTVEWLGFDGSYAHLEDVEPKTAAIPADDDVDFGEPGMKRNSRTLPNLRVTEWLQDVEHTHNSSQAFSSDSDSDAGNISRDTGPYETFWRGHTSYGPQLALNNDDGEPISNRCQQELP